MSDYRIQIRLNSDASFGRGDGVAGLIDAEVQHDDYGLPYLNGRALKGLLRDECAGILFALSQQGDKRHAWFAAAKKLFGLPGSSEDGVSALHIGDARLPEALREALDTSIAREELTREQVLNSLTAVRKQTAMDDESGAPKDNSLRAVRVILRDITFESPVLCAAPLASAEICLFAACIKALRRVGTGRNRGRGEVRARLLDAQDVDQTETAFAQFKAEVLK